MKKTNLRLLLLAAFVLTATACKSDKKNGIKNDGTATMTEKSETDSGQAKTDGIYTINTEQSTINWKGSKPTGEHIGTIAIESGKLNFTNGKATGGNLIIDMTSITVKDKDLSAEKKTMLENHLKGTAEGKETDFFNVTEYPTATFEITGTESSGEKMMLNGNLTIKEQTHAVSFPVKVSWAPDKSSVKLISENFTIDRTKWGVNYGSKSIFDNLGDNWISDEIELGFAVKASR